MKLHNKQLANRRSQRGNNPPLYPIMMVGTNKRALVVGGGQVAERKVRRLLDCNVEVTIISPSLTEFLLEMAAKKQLHWIESTWEKEVISLDEFHLVFAATNRRETNLLVGLKANNSKVLVNIVDDPEKSDFHTPSVINDPKSSTTITISSQGTDPAHTRLIREELEQFLAQRDDST
jgi:precorrin-2 dehydrogenase